MFKRNVLSLLAKVTSGQPYDNVTISDLQLSHLSHPQLQFYCNKVEWQEQIAEIMEYFYDKIKIYLFNFINQILFDFIKQIWTFKVNW